MSSGWWGSIDVNGLGLSIGTLGVVHRWLLWLMLNHVRLRLSLRTVLTRRHSRRRLMAIHLMVSMGMRRYGSSGTATGTTQIEFRR